MIFRPSFPTGLAGAAALLLAATAAPADTWRYAFEEAMDEVQGIFAQEFKSYVEENSDHTVELYPFGTLGESADIMEQTQSGILQFVDQSPGFTGSLIPEAQVFFVPYLLPTDDELAAEFFRTSKAVNEMFPELYAEQGLELFVMFPEGEMVMNTKPTIESQEDLQGVKMRTMTNPLLVESYEAFGATPTPLPWGEVYGALQTDMIQGHENPVWFINSTKMYEVTGNITYTGHNMFTTAVMANKDFFDGLSEEDQQLVRDGMTAAFDHIIEYQAGLEDEGLAAIQEADPELTVIRLTEEQQAPLREAAKQVEQRFIEMTGESGQRILDQMKADLEAVQGGSGS